MQIEMRRAQWHPHPQHAAALWVRLGGRELEFGTVEFSRNVGGVTQTPPHCVRARRDRGAALEKIAAVCPGKRGAPIIHQPCSPLPFFRLDHPASTPTPVIVESGSRLRLIEPDSI